MSTGRVGGGSNCHGNEWMCLQERKVVFGRVEGKSGGKCFENCKDVFENIGVLREKLEMFQEYEYVCRSQKVSLRGWKEVVG